VIFVDSSFWIGVAFPRDNRHEAARTLLDLHSAAALVTSNHVRGETWTVLRRRAGHRVAVRALDLIARTARVRVEFVSREQEQEALAWLGRHDEREYSFVDATSFALMRKLAIREALAFDEDFAAAGFVELRA
jgi:predicted nucleic acid-binding protein